MNAADVMVTNVITVTPNTSIPEVADLLLRNRISAVPVVNGGGEILGIVSEGDLMHRAEAGTERKRSWWLDALTSNEVLAAEFVKSHARKVADVMTRRVVTATPDTTLAEIAAILEKNGIKRVPIVADGKLVGIVSRANLLQALASAKKPAVNGKADDVELRDRVMLQLKAKPWTSLSLLNVIVNDGTVELWGMVETQAEKKAVRVLAEVTPGVRGVNDNLIVRPAMAGA